MIYNHLLSSWICNLDIPTRSWEDMECTICTAVILLAQYTIDSWRSLKKKSIPLTVQPMEDTVVRKTTIFLFYMKRFRVRTAGEVNSLYSLTYLQIDYYTTIYPNCLDTENYEWLLMKFCGKILPFTLLLIEKGW